VNVLGRAGMREFGGDEITVAVFRLLKAKLAWALNGADEGLVHHREPAWKEAAPKDGEANTDKWESYLKRFDDEINRLVPTRFRPGSNNLQDQTWQQNAFDLWDWAEQVKGRLCEEKTPVNEASINALTKNLAFRSDESSQWERLLELMQRIKIHRAEVDCLIHKSVLNSVKLCNNLIRAKLHGDNPPGDAQVHLVCLAGNGTRYPLIREALRSGLEVPFLKEDDERFVFEVQHLKHAVAKGAVLALANRAGVEVTFPDRLYERLPFDVGLRDDKLNSAELLFREGDLYTDLTAIEKDPPRTAEQDTLRLGVRQHYVYLDRRWPGEGKVWWPFLAFYFKNPIEGPVEISYDTTRHDFTVRHSGEVGQLPQDDSDERYFAPVQRGKL
jgi:hypothetical protein